MIVSGGHTLSLAPQALGETTPTLSNGYFYPNAGLTLSGRFATYAALYRVQPSIATLVDKIANSAARLTLKVWDNSPKTGKVEDKDSAFATLIARPTDMMSPYNFWRWTISTYEVYGEAFWFKQRNSDGQVTSLLPMHPSRTSVKRDEDGNVFYVFSAGVASVGLLTVPATEVVPFLRYNPDSLMRGMSRLEPLRSTLLNEDAARRATASWWKNGARPSVILRHPMELSDAAHARIKSGWNAANAGVDNMAKAAILEEGMEAQVVQLSAEEMQYVESRKLNLQEACMVYDVPPPVVHILDHATFSNITEQMRSMYRDTMSPRLEDVESVIDFYLRPDFYSDPQRTVAFALDEVLRGDFETRATAVGSLIEKGVMKPSEARPLFDLPVAGKEADMLYGNAALVPLGSSVHGQTEVDPAGNLVPSTAPMGAPKPLADTAPIGRAFDARSFARHLGQAKTQGGKVGDALVEEHRKALATEFEKQREEAKTSSKALGAGWDESMAALLHDLGTATAKAIGATIAKGLGGTYDDNEIADWLKENSVKSAADINAATLAALKTALDGADDTAAAIDATFDGPVSSRQDSISRSRVALVGGLASLNSAGQNGAGTKTWITGPNPRAEHAAMDGETVSLDDFFSDGSKWPGSNGDAPGCNCSVEYGS